MRFIIAIILSLLCVTSASASVVGDYYPPEGTTGGMSLRVLEDGTTAIEVTVSSEADGSMCKFSGLCNISNGTIKCDNLEDKADAFASLIGTVTKNSINITNGKMENVCDPRADMVGVYKSKAVTVAGGKTTGPTLPLGTLELKNDRTSSFMKLRYNAGGDLQMTIKSVATSTVKCGFEGICNVLNSTKMECRQYIDDYVVFVAGDFTGTTIKITQDSANPICPKGGVINGTYKLTK